MTNNNKKKMQTFKGSNHGHALFNGDLYHKDVYMPSPLKKKAMDMFREFRKHTILSEHVIKSRNCDVCHNYDINSINNAIKSVQETDVNIFEIGTSYCLALTGYSDDIQKFAVRIPYNSENDVIIVYGASGNVRTAWINKRSDNHCSLDRRKYVHNKKKNPGHRGII